MPPVAENYSLGLQVELNKIDSELKKLWAQGEGAMTRASLVNLAVYSEAPGSLEKNTQLIAKIAENHACRPLLLAPIAKRKKIALKPGLARIVISVAPAASKSAPNKFHSCSKDHARICCQASYFRTWIRTCRFTFGGRASFVSRWTGSFGHGSIV